MRTILNILEYFKAHPEKQMALLFLDAEKAFDNLNWSFMLEQLLAWKCGDHFYNMVKAMYTMQSARIVLNGDLTRNINIGKGTRQVCLLSLLLFIFALETLNNIIREDDRLKGLKGEEYTLQAFADDLVFILEEPQKSIVQLLQVIKEYGL